MHHELHPGFNPYSMILQNLHLDILNKLQTGVVVHGPDTQILFSNARAGELLGLSYEQMCGKTAMDSAWQFVDADGRPMPLHEYPVNRVLASGQAIKGLMLGVNASAHVQTVWLLVSAFPQFGGDGQLTQVVVDFYDISEVQRAQLILQAHEAFTTDVLDSLSEHIAVLDKDGRIVAVNQAWREFGLHNDAPTQLLTPIGMNYLDVCPASSNSLAQCEGTEAGAGIATVLAGLRNSFQLEYPCHSPSEKRWFRMNVTPLKGEHGGAVVSHLNITEQRKAAFEARLNMDLLLGSIEAIDEAFVIYDADERLVFCNEKYRQLYPHIEHLTVPGTRFEDIIRAGAEMDFYRESVGKREEWVQERLSAFRSGDQSRIQRASNGRVLRAIERKMADGHTVGFRIDITELMAANDAALAASRAKSQFLATMSHEIRTPMNGILGMAQMLLMPNLQEDVRNDYARTILSSGQTLLTLLNDILDLSKIEAGKLRLESQAFSPEALMHETSKLFASAAQAKGLQFDWQWHGDPNQRYLGDSSRLRQMLSNLVGNALKFTQAGQVRIEASVLDQTETTSMLEFAVIDTGVGIPADQLGLLFQAFSQANSSTTREFGGSGLGLSIVRHLATVMGGDVGVSSEPGRGSRFWFTVQATGLADTSNTRKAERAPSGVSAAGANNRLTGHVLVAEDNPVNCMVIESLLGQLGLTVTLVHDGQQAVDAMALSTLPDLILMDLNMPVMDGYVATTHIRQQEAAARRPRLPIIALTANAFHEDQQQCLAVGMDDFLTKPVDFEALKLALGKWLPAVQHVTAAPAVAKP